MQHERLLGKQLYAKQIHTKSGMNSHSPQDLQFVIQTELCIQMFLQSVMAQLVLHDWLKIFLDQKLRGYFNSDHLTTAVGVCVCV